jgi:hypothetical protein
LVDLFCLFGIDKLHIAHTVHFHSITNFLNQQNAQFLFIIQYNLFTVKSVQHVSVSYFWDHHQGQYKKVNNYFPIFSSHTGCICYYIFRSFNYFGSNPWHSVSEP